MSDYAPRWRRLMSGGPIIRGHWAAILGFFAAGVCFDKIEVVDRFTSQTGDYAVWWPTDTPWLLAAIALSIFGKLSLDMYGRNAWLTWADELTALRLRSEDPAERIPVTWNGLTRDDCNRTPLIRRPRWLLWKG